MTRSTIALLLGILALSLTACSDASLSHKHQYFGYHNTIIIKQEPSTDTVMVVEERSSVNHDTTMIISQPQNRTTVIVSDDPDIIVVPVAVPWWDYYRYDWYVRDCYWWRPSRTIIIYFWYPWHPISWLCSDWWYDPYWHHHRPCFSPHPYDPYAPLNPSPRHSTPTFHPSIVRYDAEIDKDVPTVPRLIGHLTPAKGKVDNVPVSPERSPAFTPGVKSATSIRSDIPDAEAGSGKRKTVLQRSSVPPTISTLPKKTAGAEKSGIEQKSILHRSGTPASSAIESKWTDRKPGSRSKPVLRRSSVPTPSRIPGAAGVEPRKSRLAPPRPSSPNHSPAKHKLPKNAQPASSGSSLHRSAHPSRSSATPQGAAIDRKTARSAVPRHSRKTAKVTGSRVVKVSSKSKVTRNAVHRQSRSKAKHSPDRRTSSPSVFSRSSTTLRRTTPINHRRHRSPSSSKHIPQTSKKRNQ